MEETEALHPASLSIGSQYLNLSNLFPRKHLNHCFLTQEILDKVAVKISNL